MSVRLIGSGDHPPAAKQDASAAGALHDFRNAVQAITSSLQLLERKVARGEKENLPAMIAAIRNQVMGINSLGTTLARAAPSGSRPEQAHFAVGPFVHAMAHQVLALLDGHTRLEVLVDNEAGHVACDPVRLESAVRNLVLNARDSMPDGGVLTLRGHTVEPEQNRGSDGTSDPLPRFAAITVADTGCGMDAEMLHRCFEPFVTTKTSGDGTGLGLFQLRAFVTEMNGAVQLRSRKGHGTEATILLPCLAHPVV